MFVTLKPLITFLCSVQFSLLSGRLFSGFKLQMHFESEVLVGLGQEFCITSEYRVLLIRSRQCYQHISDIDIDRIGINPL